jgi:hypothetical protein
MQKTEYKYFASVLLLVFALSSSAAVPAMRFLTVMYLDSVNTPAGLLEIVKDKDAEYSTFNIVLAGKRIGQVVGPSSIHAVYPNPQSARLVLIGSEAGGSGCPLFYALVEIRDKGTPIVPDSFGNCNAIDDIRFKQDAWHFRMPGPGNLPPETWVYHNGKITKLNKPSP